MTTKTIYIFGEAFSFVLCPAGSFIMGSPTDEAGRWTVETPHKVEITRPFWIGLYPVTQRQWFTITGLTVSDQLEKACTDATLYSIDKIKLTIKEAMGSKWRGIDPEYEANCPMYFVNWHESVAFCDSVCQISGYQLRLPTEAEWEYACRAGTTTATYAGELDLIGENFAPSLDPIAWYAGNCTLGYEGPGCIMTDRNEMQFPGAVGGVREVGQKIPNSWGAFDMLGNVFEWCQDWYAPYGSSLVDPTGPDHGEMRIPRGGSWFRFARCCRAANRGWDPPSYRAPFLGFRMVLACDLPEPCRYT